MPDLQQMAGEVIATVKSYVGKALDSITPRIEAVERRLDSLPSPEKGEPGKDADIADLIPTMEAEIAKRVEALPKAQDGTSVTVDDVLPAINAAVDSSVKSIEERVVASLPVEVRPILEEMVKSSVAQIPHPKDGKSVELDDVLSALESKMADWIVGFERHAQGVLERAAERIPKPKDGKDGLGFDDLCVVDQGNGRFSIKFQNGDLVKEFPIRVPRFLERGIFKDSETYEAGDGVTWAGSFWIAGKDEPEGKPGESKDWRLAVKRGRDGKDGRLLPPNTGPVKL